MLGGKRRVLRVEAPEVFLVLFLVLAVGSSFWSLDGFATIFKSSGLALSYLCLRMIAARYQDWKDSVDGLAAVIHFLLFMTFAELVFFPSQTFTTRGVEDVERLSAVVPTIGTNLLALLCVIGIVTLMFGVGPKWLLALRLPVGALYVALLLLTRSRTAIVVGVLLISIWAIYAARRSVLAFAASAITVAAGLVLVVANWDALVDFTLRGQDVRGLTTLTGRTTAWDEGVQLWQTSPLFGVGYYAGHRFGILDGSRTNIDNTWLETLVDTGAFGLVLLIGFVAIGVIRTWRTTLSATDGRAWLVRTMLTALVIISFFNPTAQSATVNQFLLGWLILNFAPHIEPERAVSYAAGSLRPKRRRTAGNRWKRSKEPRQST